MVVGLSVLLFAALASPGDCVPGVSAIYNRLFSYDPDDYIKIAGFQPRTPVADVVSRGDKASLSRSPKVSFSHSFFYSLQAMIDMDIKLMMDIMVKDDEVSDDNNTFFEMARRVYNEGAYSRPYAQLTLSQPLKDDIKQGTRIRSWTQDAKPLTGVVLRNVYEGEDKIGIEYNISGINSGNTHEGCYVGANPKPVFTGCKEFCCFWLITSL
jgi:hypothetical protein